MSSIQQLKEYNSRLKNQVNQLKNSNETLRNKLFKANLAMGELEDKLTVASGRRYFWEFWKTKY